MLDSNGIKIQREVQVCKIKYFLGQSCFKYFYNIQLIKVILNQLIDEEQNKITSRYKMFA